MIQAPRWEVTSSGLLAGAATKPIRFKVPEERVGAIINRVEWNPDTPPGPRSKSPCSLGDRRANAVQQTWLLPLSSALFKADLTSLLKAGVSLAQSGRCGMSQDKLIIHSNSGLGAVVLVGAVH